MRGRASVPRPRLVPDSADLTRLVNEGYAVRIRRGHLLIEDIPYVTTGKTIARGALMCPLDTQGTVITKPANHVMWFAGGVPCTKDGVEIPLLIHGRGPQPLTDGIVADFSFSQKPSPDGYDNYYDKVVTYTALIAGHAQALDPAAVATTFKPVQTDEDDEVFNYFDSNSSRAGITALTDRLALGKIAIVGLGGTGSYLLDLVAKLPIGEIHLYDGDVFSTHNVFRSPGAASIEDLNAAPRKVDYHAARYEPLRRGLSPHAEYVTAANVDELLAMDFVFLAMDANPDKKLIVDRLTDSDVPFIDTGIGVLGSADGLAGLVRVTTSVPGRRHHLADDNLISYALGDADDYESNIQVAELNALAATLAVLAFKKKYGFYRDEARELHTLYRVDSNELLNTYGDEAAPEDEGEEHT